MIGAALLLIGAALLLSASRTDGTTESEWSEAGPDDYQGEAEQSGPGLIEALAGMMGAATVGNGDGMRLSGAGLDALKRREGFSAVPYWDHKGYSIGYGHLMGVFDRRQSITLAEAEALLIQDVAWAEDAVNQAVQVPLSQAQFDALVSLAFNIGEGAFKRSTLVRRINAGDAGAVSEFARWNRASGQVNAGLVARRADESAQFNGSA